MQAIHCKYRADMRIKAECGAASLIFTPAGERDEQARMYAACEALQQKIAPTGGANWLEGMVGGCLKDGTWVFVFASSRATRADSREEIELTRVDCDGNGNPRYVVHFLALNTRQELDDMKGDVGGKYELALKRARTIGGRKFHNKQYGGGIVFQCYGKSDLLPLLERVTGRQFK